MPDGTLTQTTFTESARHHPGSRTFRCHRLTRSSPYPRNYIIIRPKRCLSGTWFLSSAGSPLSGQAVVLRTIGNILPLASTLQLQLPVSLNTLYSGCVSLRMKASYLHLAHGPHSDELYPNPNSIYTNQGNSASHGYR